MLLLLLRENIASARMFESREINLECYRAKFSSLLALKPRTPPKRVRSGFVATLHSLVSLQEFDKASWESLLDAIQTKQQSVSRRTFFKVESFKWASQLDTHAFWICSSSLVCSFGGAVKRRETLACTERLPVEQVNWRSKSTLPVPNYQWQWSKVSCFNNMQNEELFSFFFSFSIVTVSDARAFNSNSSIQRLSWRTSTGRSWLLLNLLLVIREFLYL